MKQEKANDFKRKEGVPVKEHPKSRQEPAVGDRAVIPGYPWLGVVEIVSVTNGLAACRDGIHEFTLPLSRLEVAPLPARNGVNTPGTDE